MSGANGLKTILGHDELAEEMTKGGFKHRLPLKHFGLVYLSKKQQKFRVDGKSSHKEP